MELVDADNRPVPLGTESDKVLVTNLYNRTQPLIRYELDDHMVRLPDAEDHGHPRVMLSGRSDNLLRYGAVTVHPIAVRSVMVRESEVVEYQVTQTARAIHVDCIGAPGPALGERLTAALAGSGVRSPVNAV